MGKVFKKEIGITLIALVVTIVVLLILAGVSIVTLTGENGILTQAETAKTETTKAEVEENFRLLANEWQIAKAKGKSLGDFLNEKKALGELDNVTENSDGTFKIENNEYKETINVEGNFLGEDYKPSFNPETLEIGTAINTDKYGHKVKDYTVTTNDCPSGAWRLFYQDSNYTYLINDELTATSYLASDYYTTITKENGGFKYQSGADVSTVGQKLSPIISSLFTESNTNENIRFTAWITDPMVWSDYKDDNGDAVFAIGSPTMELFAASYNNRSNKSNIIELDKGTYGYSDNIQKNWLSQSDNYGVYNKSYEWWHLASPMHSWDGTYGMFVNGAQGYCWSNVIVDLAFKCRPTVCIPTFIFNNSYMDSVVAE